MKNINDRLVKIAQHYGLASYAKFAEKAGLSHQTASNYLKGKQKPDVEKLSQIKQSFEGINANWLLTGKGDMLNTDNPLIANEGVSTYKLITDSNVTSQKVPLYDIDAMASIVPLFQNSEEVKPIDHISIPNLPKCDGAVYVAGDSMYPLLKSGDIVMYKEVIDIENDIYWGQMYLISISSNGDEYVMVKYIQKSELGAKYIKLVSQNKHHQDKDVLISKIRALALVKASIRINTMN